MLELIGRMDLACLLQFIFGYLCYVLF